MKVETTRRSVGIKSLLVFSLAIGAVAASTGVVGKTTVSTPPSQVWSLPDLLEDGLADRSGNEDRSSVRDEARRRRFIVGRDFSLAVFNASRLKKDQHAAKHLIVDLVYLMDRLEGEREAAALQKVLTKVVKDTSTADAVSAQIEDDAKRYRSRLKGEDGWYFDVGYTALHLSLASYNNIEASVRKDLL